MIVLDLPKVSQSARPRFQIIINGPLKLTMLMQIDTGRSWQFGIDPQERLIAMIWAQHAPNAEFGLYERFNTLVYQALVR